MIEALDLIKNKSYMRAYINIDCDAPKINTEVDNGWSPNDWKGSVVVTDEHSGIDSIVVTCDDEVVESVYTEAKQQYEMCIDLSKYKVKKHDIRIIAGVKVGNSSECSLPVIFDDENGEQQNGELRTRMRSH